jgi:hypothetical protein
MSFRSVYMLQDRKHGAGTLVSPTDSFWKFQNNFWFFLVERGERGERRESKGERGTHFCLINNFN